MISIVLPTVDGREDIFELVHGTYLWTPNAEIIVIRNAPTVGAAWQAGAEKAKGDYLHFANDDCLPGDGWYEDAVQTCDAGYIPAANVHNPAGYPQSLPEWGVETPDWTRVHCCLIPFMSRAQWEKIGPCFTGHYYTDEFLTWRAARERITCVHRTRYAFTHFWAQPGRGAGMPEHARMSHDKDNFETAKRMVAEGTWEHPWPTGGRG